MEFFNYHKHSHLSNLAVSDSGTIPSSYIKRAIELGHTKISSCEHGASYNWSEYWLLCKKHKLKYVHCAEFYFVEDRFQKDSSNYHIVVIAKTQNAFRKMNLITSLSQNLESFYYRHRIDIELLKLLPKGEYIVTTACVGGILADGWTKLSESILEIVGRDNFYLEIQSHNTEKQIAHNNMIKVLSKRLGLKVIAGCDSHYALESEKDKRDLFIAYKSTKDDNEIGWYMDYPSGDELFDRFKQQGVFTDNEIFEAINNTNIETEEIIINTKLKIPSIYPDKTIDEKLNIYKDIMFKEYDILMKDKSKKEKVKYKKAIIEEYNIVEQTGIVDYFLFNHKVIELGKKYGGILTKTARGSSSSFLSNKLLGFTTLDRLNSKVPMLMERFIGIDRILKNNSCADKFCPLFIAI